MLVMTGDLAMRLRTPKDYTGRGEKEVEDSILKGTGVPKIAAYPLEGSVGIF